MELTLNERTILSDIAYTEDDINILNKFMKLRKMDEHTIVMKFLIFMETAVKNTISQNISEDEKIYNIAVLFNRYKYAKNTTEINRYKYAQNTTESTHLSSQYNDKPYEQVNHPSHYNKYDVEVVDMMEKIWGKQETAIWCKLTAFKYRMRLGEKPDNPIQQDLNKESWYLQKYNQLKSELENS